VPKETFNKLNPKKKEAFLADAFAEFALNGYGGSSLTQLVKSLGIAKGSLYQYFENKLDMYYFLITEACRRKLTFFEVINSQTENNFIFSSLVVSAKFDLAFPAQGTLIYQSISQPDPAIREIMKAQFAEKIVGPALGNTFLFNSALIANFQAIFNLLLDRHKINLLEAIEQKSAIKLSGPDILQVIQSYLNTNKEII